MGRLTERVSSMLDAIDCPGCGKTVTPTTQGDAEAPPADGRRMSFVWRPSSRATCPECGFPIERFLRRQRWIRLFLGGVVLVTVGATLFMVDWIRGAIGGVATWSGVGMAGLGAVLLVSGLVGIVIGEHARMERGQ